MRFSLPSASAFGKGPRRAARIASQLACPDHCHDAGADCPEQLGADVDDGRPFPLEFRLPAHRSRSKFNVAESAFHDLEPEESGMLSPFPNGRRRSPRLQTVPDQAALEWRDRSQTRSSEGN